MGSYWFRNGEVCTLDPARPRAASMVVHDESIAFVGDDDAARRHLRPDTVEVDLEGGCHESFASGLPCPTLDTDLGFRVIGVYTLAFARLHVLGDDSAATAAVLDGTTVVDPLARVNPF